MLYVPFAHVVIVFWVVFFFNKFETMIMRRELLLEPPQTKAYENYYTFSINTYLWIYVYNMKVYIYAELFVQKHLKV